MPVKVNIDAYGKYARSSALADFLELRALAEKGITQADLQDWFRDSNLELEELILTPGESAEEPDLGLDEKQTKELQIERDAAKVFAIISERSRLLKDNYPFELDAHGKLKAKTKTCPYLAILAITTAHAYSIATENDPKQVFEDTVSNIFSGHWKKLNFGKLCRDKRDFAEAIEAASTEFGFPMDAGAPARHRYTFDMKLDTLCYHSWLDNRPGKWALLGQVTCGRSETWEAKAMEPKSNPWAKVIGDEIEPIAFLAVPHHVEPRHLFELVQNTQRMVLDRIRIANFKTEVTEAEANVLKCVLEAGIEDA